MAATRPWRAHRLETLFTLTGVWSLGGPTLERLAVHTAASCEDEACLDLLRRWVASPLRAPIWVFLAASLAVHTCVGIGLFASRRALLAPPPYSPAVARAVRATGVLAFAHVASHLVEEGMTHPSPDAMLTVLSARLSSTVSGVPVWALVQLAGLGAVSFHLPARVWAWLAARGCFGSLATKRRAMFVLGLVGASLFVWGTNLIVFFATGSRWFGF